MADTNLGFNPPNPFQPPPAPVPPPQQGVTVQPQGQAAPEPAADLQRPPVGAPGGPATTPNRIPLDFEEYKRLTGIEKQYEEDQRRYSAELEAKEEERLRALAAKGQSEEAFSVYKKNYEEKLLARDEIIKQRESAWLNAEKMRVVNEVMAGLNFVGDPTKAARMVRLLLESEIEAVMGKDGIPVIRDRERGRPALEYLKERIEHPDFELNPLLKARQGGGAGTDGTRGAGPPPQPASGQPLTPEEAIKTWQRSQGLPSFGVHRIPRTG